MGNLMQRITRRTAAVLSSRRFGIAVLAFFVLEAAWIACSALYPMAFDEEFHFGLIKIYSQHWLPFFGSQPHGFGQFGPFVSDPSYLYHYLMSFPYRLLHVFTHSQTALVIVLRFMNIVFFSTGLLLFYRLLRRVGTSRLLANTALALFVLIPIVPLLAGQINYDNLLFPLMAWTCLLVADVYGDLRKRQLNLKTLTVLVSLLMLSSLVKYAFLPIALAVAIFLGASLLHAFWRRGAELKKAFNAAHARLDNRAKVLLMLLLVVSAGLFVQRYGVNMVSYHKPVPDCDDVLTIDDCLDYGPWARNYYYTHAKGDFDDNVLHFARTWYDGMYFRLFFMITGPTNDYANSPPLEVPSRTALVLGIAAGLAFAVYWRRTLRDHALLLFLLLIVVLYCSVLWVNSYQDYQATAQPVAINGRYLLVILFPLIAVVGRSLAIALRRWRALRVWLAAAAIVLFLQGGGVFSFILRSNETWYWPNRAVAHANNAARKVLDPLIVEGRVPPLQ